MASLKEQLMLRMKVLEIIIDELSVAEAIVPARFSKEIELIQQTLKELEDTNEY